MKHNPITPARKRRVTITESDLRNIVKQVIRENEEERYLSDDDIHKQYENFKIKAIDIHPNYFGSGSYYWSGVMELAFPEADHPDFEEYVIENFIAYDETGERIGFDHWYPGDIGRQLCNAIRNEIKKQWPEMEALKRKYSLNESIRRAIRRYLR